jgi:hypothetical protein
MVTQARAMAAVREEAELGAGPDEAPVLVGDSSACRAMGFAGGVRGPGVGAVRTISSGPQPVVERLEQRDEDAKRIVYAIATGCSPVANYRSAIGLARAEADQR